MDVSTIDDKTIKIDGWIYEKRGINLKRVRKATASPQIQGKKRTADKRMRDAIKQGAINIDAENEIARRLAGQRAGVQVPPAAHTPHSLFTFKVVRSDYEEEIEANHYQLENGFVIFMTKDGRLALSTDGIKEIRPIKKEEENV